MSNDCYQKVEEIFAKFHNGQLPVVNKRTWQVLVRFLEGKDQKKRLQWLSQVATGTKTLTSMRKMQRKATTSAN